MKLNLGCGQIRPDGWLNTDSSVNALLQRNMVGRYLAKAIGLKLYESANLSYMNLNKPWYHIKDGAVEVVYASHLFEHLSQASTDVFLREAFRTLISGGCLRLVVPDLEAHARTYLQDIEDGKGQKASEQFMWALNLHREGQYPNHRRLHNFMGFLQGYPHQHKFMYDEYSLGNLLEKYGFSKIMASSYGTSKYIQAIADVEREGLGGYGNSLYLEAIKP